jgi:signal transduction histidine kinase
VDANLEILRSRLRHHGIQVDLDYAAPPQLRCVPTQLSQVLLNLLINAVQAIESAGRKDGGRIHLSTRQVGDQIHIEVSDNGCGIDPDDLPRLFDPFFTTKPVGEGTGLGLSISHGIIAGHGGSIDVDSRLGEGSRFRISLPVDPKRGAR